MPSHGNRRFDGSRRPPPPDFPAEARLDRLRAQTTPNGVAADALSPGDAACLGGVPLMDAPANAGRPATSASDPVDLDRLNSEIVAFVEERIRASGTDVVVVAPSVGVNSTVATMLAVEALGLVGSASTWRSSPRVATGRSAS